MKKKSLLTPGPTPVPQEVLLSMTKPTIHHRTQEFRSIFKQVSDNLKYVFQTKNHVLTFTASGTAAMEAAVVNLLSPNDTAICVGGGKFADRWSEICKTYSINTIDIDVEWGKAVDPALIKKVLNKNKNVKAVFTTLCETSTGVLTDIKKIAAIVKKTNAVLVTDAISALAGEELKTDEWGIDVVVCGSQKGLMVPPGLSFCSVSKKAWRIVEKSKSPRFYLDFTKAKKASKTFDTAFTPAITLFIGLNEALKMIRKETLEKVIKRQKRLSSVLRKAIKALGLKVFSKNPSNVVTAVYLPEKIDAQEMIKTMRDEYGITVAGGQGHLKGKIIRIGSMGNMHEFDIINGISCMELVLAKMGYKFKHGAGLAAAEKELLKSE